MNSFKEFGKVFSKHRVEGSIIVLDNNRKQIFEHNYDRNRIRFSPCSTFKILNSLISLELGVIHGIDSVFRWDGISREIKNWNQDLSLKQAFKFSAVWFYKILAREIGYKNMISWINRVNYGNNDIGSKENIDSFWLSKDLKITPLEQINFLSRLYNAELPFTENTLNFVKEMMIFRRFDEFLIMGKSGWSSKYNFGWFVGYLENSDNVLFFATNIIVENKSYFQKRIDVTLDCLYKLL